MIGRILKQDAENAMGTGEEWALLKDAVVLVASERDAEECYIYQRGNVELQEPMEEFEQSAFDSNSAKCLKIVDNIKELC